MPCHKRGNCKVSLHCELCCAQQGDQNVWNVYYKPCIQTVSLLNELDCVLSILHRLENTFHIHCTCIYWCDHSYVFLSNSDMKNISHTEYMNMTCLQHVFVCAHSKYLSLQTVCHTLYTHTALACYHANAQWHHYYRLQSRLQRKFHLYNIHNTRLFSTLRRFKCTIANLDFTKFLVCNSHILVIFHCICDQSVAVRAVFHFHA